MNVCKYYHCFVNYKYIYQQDNLLLILLIALFPEQVTYNSEKLSTHNFIIQRHENRYSFMQEHMLVCVCLCVYFRRILLLWTSVVSDCATQWTVASQAPLSMGFSWQEYWNGLPCPSPRYLPNPGIKPTSSAAPALQADSLPLTMKDGKVNNMC